MMFVIFEDIVPDVNERGNGRIAARMAMVGFVVMMGLEIGFEGVFED